jgi:hypothetical protein
VVSYINFEEKEGLKRKRKGGYEKKEKEKRGCGIVKVFHR